jgi:hypothetical protein
MLNSNFLFLAAAFLDMLMSMLTEADDNVDNSTDLSFIPVFKKYVYIIGHVYIYI